ncbi:MAG: fused MFS/spermidine synthase [Nanoarchaeota archaeon]
MKKFLYVTCFITGAVVLILEVLGFRLFAPYFGNSVYVSGSLIGIILAALSLGYFLGGMLADKYPSKKNLYYLIFSSGIYLSLVFIFYKKFLLIIQGFGIVYGTIFSTIIVFWIPMTLLSMVSPYIIKLLANEKEIGRISGNIFSISTLGSITGSFLATFFLLPYLGTNTTLKLSIIILFAISIIGLIIEKKINAGMWLFLLLVIIPQPVLKDPGLIYETESSYNIIKIYENYGIRYMTLNNPKWRQSYLPTPGKILESYREYFNLAPYIVDVKDVLILGMSAGASVHELRTFFNVSIDAVEIDPKVVELAKEYFAIKDDNYLNIYVEDARTFIQTTDKKYDFIEIDLFHGGPEIPFYTATKEFFESIYDRTSDNGIVMMNVLGSVESDTGELVNAIGDTMTVVFPSVFVFPMDGNSIIIATKQKMGLDEIKKKLQITDFKVFANNMRKDIYIHVSQGNMLTDDKSNVELMSQKILRKL